VPQEVWSAGKGAFVPYSQAGKPKPIEWGSVISEAEAKELMGVGESAAGSQRDPSTQG
jgi:hypothetical protein